MRLLLVALVMVLASHAANADPPKSRASGIDNQQIAEVAKPATDTEKDETKAAEERNAADWKDKSGDAATYESICRKPQYTEYADLCQQWRSAQAASKQVEIAQNQLWATYWEIGALVASLVLTAIAAFAAAKASNAAAETVATQINGERARMGVFGLRKETRGVDNGKTRIGNIAYNYDREET